MSHDNPTWPSMEAHGKPQYETEPPKFTPTNNAYLRTPDEPMVNSFSSVARLERVEDAQQIWQKLPPIQPATPPASPLPGIASTTGFSTDAPLYPESQTDRRRSQTPLFPEIAFSPTAPRPRTASSGNGHGFASPTCENDSQPQQATGATRSNPWPAFGVSTSMDARDYYRRRVNELQAVPRIRGTLPPPTKSKSPARDSISEQQVRRLTRPAGVSKPRTQSRVASRQKASVATPSVQRTSTSRKKTPKASPSSDQQDGSWTASHATKHKRAPPSKKVEDRDVHWTELTDYSPPTSTLDAGGKKLSAWWDNGHSKPLEEDPDVHHLHPQEKHIAETLRLEGHKYMYNKRKIFQARLQALKDGKNFTKTAAQGACNIDVNKASRLWDAYNGAGWFDESWFEQFL